MKLLNLGISSIVDANTGNGINHQYVNQFGFNKTDHAKLGAEIRANAVLDLIRKIKTSVIQYIDSSKALAQDRRDAKEILQMSEHMLKDVGLTLNDVYDLRFDLISLDTLNTRRVHNRNQEVTRLNQSNQPPKQASISTNKLESANQETYELKKCA